MLTTAARLVRPARFSVNPSAPYSIVLRKMSSSADAYLYLVQPSSQPSANAGVGEKLWAKSRTASSKSALDTRVLYDASSEQGKEGAVVSLVSLGEEWTKKDSNARREVVRKAAGKGIGKIEESATSTGVSCVQIDGSLDAHAAGMLRWLF